MDKTPKILIVDDKPENLIVLEKLLNHLSVDIFKAHSGEEALKLTLKHDFVLALLDVQMPEMDGYQVLEAMSWDEKTKYIPVIFITANYRDEVHKLRGYAYGAVDYLDKPINEEEPININLTYLLLVNIEKKAARITKPKTYLVSMHKGHACKNKYLSIATASKIIKNPEKAIPISK